MSIIEAKTNEIEKLKKELCELISKSISSIPQNTAVKQVSASVCALTVSMSEISKNNLILDPVYYDFEKQKKIVLDKIKQSKDGGVSYLRRIVQTKADREVRFHPDFLKQIQEILEK